MLLDIHSHILPTVDDGARDVEASLQLLEIMKQQGITHVIATPHFYPQEDTIEDFENRIQNAYNLLKSKATKDLPEIFIGCELFYYRGISQSEFIKNFTFKNTNILLLEPNPHILTKALMNEILYMRDELNLTPVIAHIERYHRSPGFKEFIKFIKQNEILTQVNASSFVNSSYNRVLKKLINDGVVSFIATDTHSLNRPPLMSEALAQIKKRFSEDFLQKLLTNSQNLLNQLTEKDI